LQKVPVIAIVDDDESVRTATRSLVRSLGFTAYTFASAEEFLQSQHVAKCSCVITDVQMPGLSGVDLQSRLAAEGRDTPIIFMTAFADQAVKARAMKAGAVCFLSKPFEGQKLVKCLEEALSQDKAPQQ
jgi:FixJ family two-component response regulator